MKSKVDIGTRVEMFVDDWLIDRIDNAALKLHPPIKKERVMEFDKPWEGPAAGYFTAFQDGDKVRLYYRGHCPDIDSNESQVTCYAESDDGIHFERPNLELWEFRGSKENNIVWRGFEGHNLTPFKDSNPEAPKAQRYKAIGGAAPAGAPLNTGLVYALVSSDGFHWKRIQQEPVMTKGAFDSQNVAFWDRKDKVYRCYSRYFDMNQGKGGIRAVQSSTSKDFISWEDPKPNLYKEGVPMEHFYTNATLPCPGAEHIYLSFPKRFFQERKKVLEHPHDGVSDTVLMSSRDGIHWDRTFMEAWIRPGLDIKNWTDRSNQVAWGIIPTSPQEFSMYVLEHYRWNDNGLRRLAFRRHGFASVNAGYGGGEFITRPLIFDGTHLILNYSTSAAGFIQVEIQDEKGRALEGYRMEDMEPLYGDELEYSISWKDNKDLSSLVGKPVRFRFVLKDADVFSLRTSFLSCCI